MIRPTTRRERIRAIGEANPTWTIAEIRRAADRLAPPAPVEYPKTREHYHRCPTCGRYHEKAGADDEYEFCAVRCDPDFRHSELFAELPPSQAQPKAPPVVVRYDEKPAHGSTLVLIGCGQAKLDQSAPAAEMYTSTLYRLARKFAESHGYHWRILSAKHGLLRPDALIETYDQRLQIGRGACKAKRWGRRLEPALDATIRENDIERVIILAGDDYARGLSGWRAAGVLVDWPLDGLQIGERQQWLKTHQARPADKQRRLF